MQIDMERVVQHTIFWYDGDMEPQLSWAVGTFLPVGGTLVDCGANCGFIGLEARLIRRARILFIEPHPELAATIQANITLNGWDDTCRRVQAAASDTAGQVTLFVCEAYDGSHSLHADWWHRKDQTNEIRVPMVTLAQLIQSDPTFRTVDFLKIDTEGNDFTVMLGLGDLLVPDRIPVVYAELARDRDKARLHLLARGYSGFAYRRHGKGRELRRDVRRSAEGEAVAFYLPLDKCPNPGETLWVEKGSPREALLLELASRAATR